MTVEEVEEIMEELLKAERPDYMLLEGLEILKEVIVDVDAKIAEAYPGGR
jgi:hypothetical protein